MPPIDWLLLTLHPHDDALTLALDPIRIQKALFYISCEGSIPATEKYEFEPYNYGPYSRAIYHDLDMLMGEELVAPVPAGSRRWSRYALTRTGQERVHELLLEVPAEWVELAARTRSMVTQLSFRDLLRRVYRDHPEYAVNSIATL